MNQPQRKLSKTFTSPVSIDDPANPSVQIADINTVAATASPARAMQERLTEELDATPIFQDSLGGLKMIASFVGACAATWIFGALLYAQL